MSPRRSGAGPAIPLANAAVASLTTGLQIIGPPLVGYSKGGYEDHAEPTGRASPLKKSWRRQGPAMPKRSAAMSRASSLVVTANQVLALHPVQMEAAARAKSAPLR